MRPSLLLAFASRRLVAACSKPSRRREPVRAVETMTVSTQSPAATQEYAGEVRARTESRLSFRVGGKMLRRFADLGDTVRPGQALAQLDPQDLSSARTRRALR